MGCNSSKSTKVDENSNIENEEQAAAEEQGPVFYTWGFSPFCRAVAMVAAELEVDLAHKEINPNKTVPALTHGDIKLGESRTIAVYLVNTFGPENSLHGAENIQLKAKIDEMLVTE